MIQIVLFAEFHLAANVGINFWFYSRYELISTLKGRFCCNAINSWYIECGKLLICSTNWTSVVHAPECFFCSTVNIFSCGIVRVWIRISFFSFGAHINDYYEEIVWAQRLFYPLFAIVSSSRCYFFFVLFSISARTLHGWCIFRFGYRLSPSDFMEFKKEFVYLRETALCLHSMFRCGWISFV